jgi:hypothetical protein
MSKMSIGNQGNPEVQNAAVEPIICEPQVVCRDYYRPQVVQVIHPYEVINRIHSVPVYQHYYTMSERNVVLPGYNPNSVGGANAGGYNPNSVGGGYYPNSVPGSKPGR